ncbi:hypothetical protein HY638_05175 [Candidatus Woesearchaeota archaeon]|nr:hypothetical protein [Candidatus Woesearchaeota archaeon]
MQQLKFLNKKETKQILEMLESRWGFKGELDYVFMLNSKNRVYIVNRDISGVDMDKLRIDSVGMYFGEILGNEIRLSIEGSQMIGGKCSKNILEINDNEFREWLAGNDLHKEEGSGFMLVRHNEDFVGCGKAGKDKFYNYIGKNRRITASELA